MAPPTTVSWGRTHAALPALVERGAGAADLYVSTRDEQGRARIGVASVHWSDTPAVGAVEQKPVLDLGSLGAFDDNGVTSSCVVVHEGRTYLYYTGWTLGVTVPFFFFAGCAVRERDHGPFLRVTRAPVLERNDVDPYLTASPWVIVEDGLWRMWYVSCVRWERLGDEARHWYHIRYAESDDGLEWRRNGHVCIDFAADDEYAISRPCVIREDDRYRMWFASRGAAYRIGYAESPDGLEWSRCDDPSGMPARGTEDAEMQAYPVVGRVGGRRVLLYNGDGYGRTGVLWAESGV